MSMIVSVSVLIIAVISVLLFIGIIILGISIYNSLVTLNVNIDRSLSNIDVLLKQRFDEIPRLVEVCKGYMAHERETLQKVVEARNIFINVGANAEKFSANSALDKALGSLFAVSEGYPELKANEEFMHLHRRITAIENQIAERREFYNASVAIFNTRVRQIPDMAIANMLGYKVKPMFKAETKSELDINPVSFS